MTTKRVFLSVANRQHETFRAQLRAVLTRTQFFDVVVQPDFPHTTSDTISKLDVLIAPCDLVIHIVGSDPGSRANVDAVSEYFTRTDRDSFLAVFPKSRKFLGDFSHLTYFQWEPWLALHRKIDLLVYGEEGHAKDDFPQRDHLDALYLARKHAETLQPIETRCAQIVADVCQHFGIIPPAIQQKIAPSRLVSRHTSSTFLGRETELALLDAAWDGVKPNTGDANSDSHAASPEPWNVNLLSLIAWGGVGKTALLAEWVDRRFRKKKWKNAEDQPEPLLYFDWTFYDQGTRSDDASHAGAASVGTFFVEALRHFGDPQPDVPERKARRLATLIQQHRSLLVLDGLEPLQYPPNHPQAGQITDPDLCELLGTLAQSNPGLCVITSRQQLTDLSGLAQSTAPQHDLDRLPDEVAISLLRKLQITGSDEDLKQAAIDYQGHALSLILLGRYLFVAKGGDVRKRDTVKFERASKNRNAQTRNAWHVLEAYEQWLASPNGRTEDLQALRLVGLFDRPASPDCLAALRRAPAIPGLTDQLVPLADDEWNAVLHRLHEAHLIALGFPETAPGSTAPRPAARGVPVDAHPLIREYFGQQLRKLQVTRKWWQFWRTLKSPFQTAHSRLFDHLLLAAPERTLVFKSFLHWQRSMLGLLLSVVLLCLRCIVDSDLRRKVSAAAFREQRPSLEDLQPLYQAVVHGCLAGRQQQACDKVYVNRILRGTGENGHYSVKKLGAIGEDLGAIAAFFEQPWTRLSPNLFEADQAWLLNQAALCLRALGRLTEALEPMRTVFGRDFKKKLWREATSSVTSLSELEAILGRLGEAADHARSSIDFADCSGRWVSLLTARTTTASALHQWGSWDGEVGSLNVEYAGAAKADKKARQLFEQAEALLRECELDVLHSVPGFQYCDLILAPAERAAWKSSGEGIRRAHVQALTKDLSAALAEAERRANAVQKYRTGLPTYALLDIALDHLTLSRVALYRAALTGQPPYADANPHLAPALDGLRKAGTVHHVPKALLTAAQWHALIGDAATAERFLAEAQQIAERGPMPLYLADVHLHRARIVGRLNPADRAIHFPNIDPKDELAKAKALIEKHEYGRRTEELADAEQAATNW